MRRFTYLLVVCVTLRAVTFGASTIPELRLADGTTLKNVEFVSFATTAVMAKWDGGRGTIRYSELPADVARSIDNFRPAARDSVAPRKEATSPAKAKPSPAPSPEVKPVHVTGTAFSGGTEQPYRFAGMKIQVVTKAHADLTRSIGLEHKVAATEFVAEVETDVEGKFGLDLPPGKYVLIAKQLRSYRTRARAVYYWEIEFDPSASSTVILNDDNAKLDVNLAQIIAR